MNDAPKFGRDEHPDIVIDLAGPVEWLFVAALCLTTTRALSSRFCATQARCYHALAPLHHDFELVKFQPSFSDSNAVVHRSHPCGDFLLCGGAADADYDFTQLSVGPKSA